MSATTAVVSVKPLELSGAQKRIASRAIEDTHLAYYEKGGLRDTLEKARVQSEGVSSHIYSLARYAAKTAPSLEQARVLFGALCRHAEDAYKTVHEIENIKDPEKGLPVWPVFKSNIAGAMSLEL